ncbi:TPA: hypothetical protein ACGOR8_000085 [Streptococcus suis]
MCYNEKNTIERKVSYEEEKWSEEVHDAPNGELGPMDYLSYFPVPVFI